MMCQPVRDDLAVACERPKAGHRHALNPATDRFQDFCHLGTISAGIVVLAIESSRDKADQWKIICAEFWLTMHPFGKIAIDWLPQDTVKDERGGKIDPFTLRKVLSGMAGAIG